MDAALIVALVLVAAVAATGGLLWTSRSRFLDTYVGRHRR